MISQLELVILASATLIGLIHFFGEEIDEKFSTNSLVLKSFSAGFTISYFFLSMLPEINKAETSEIGFIWVLSGFSLFYIIEEVIYNSTEHIKDVKHEFKELHTVFLATYHLCIGIILFSLSNNSLQQGILFYLPVATHTLVNSLAIKEMHEEMLKNTLIKLITSFATVIGVLIGIYFKPGELLSFSLFGLVGGMFIYLVVHDSLSPKKERPLGYIAGAAAFLAIITLI